MSISENLQKIKSQLPPNVTLVVVSKTYSPEKILEAYNSGHKIFGENKVQELVPKYEALPKDIQWHLIGHLQTNKVKYIAPFVSLIHSVDSFKLLKEINKEALKNNRVIDCLLQIHIATEETKFGLSFEEAEHLISSEEIKQLRNVNVIGLMGMATNMEDGKWKMENGNTVRNEFHALNAFFSNLKSQYSILNTLSMGMSSDYHIAIEEGSNMVRVGSAIFGSRS